MSSSSRAEASTHASWWPVRCRGVGYAVHHAGREVEDLAARIDVAQQIAERSHALLEDGAGHHGDGTRRACVIVKARVLSGHPADEPGAHVLVAVDLGIDPLIGVVADQRRPGVGAKSEAGDRTADLLLREAARVTPEDHAAVAISVRSRFGFRRRMASARREGKRDGTGLASGRSEPYTSWLVPTQWAIARSARGPYDDVS